MGPDVFNQVFQTLVDRSEYSDAEIARRLGVNRSTISRWKAGEQSPPLSKIPQIAALFGVHPTVFVSGEIGTYDEAKIMIEKFNALDDIGKHTIRTVLDAEFKRCKDARFQPVAAHNDDVSEEQLKLMREDLDEL